MFGRVVFVATLGVAAALLGSFSLLERLPAPAPVAAAPAPAAVASAPDNAAPEQHAVRQVFSYREIALRADARGQYAADTLVNGMPVRMLVDTGATLSSPPRPPPGSGSLPPAGPRASFRLQTADRRLRPLFSATSASAASI
jgi:hypothetical protein